MNEDRIAALQGPKGSLISVYVNRPSPGGYAALLSDLLKPIKERAETLDRDVRLAVRADAERIRDLAEKLEVDSAPAHAIFASELDEIFIVEALTAPVIDFATMGVRPYLRPLRAGPRPLRAAIIVADRGLARTFVSSQGLVEELGKPLLADLGKSNFGGFSGYEEHGVRAHAEEETNRIWREAGARLLAKQKKSRFDYLAIGSHEETVEEIARTLHPYLARLQRVSFVANPHTLTMPVLRAEVAELDAEVRRERQEALAGRVCETAWSGGNAVLGLSATLDAVNAQAVDTLTVAGWFMRPGTLCESCGHLARQGEVCPVCGAEVFPVDDLVGPVMDAVIQAGGTVHQLDVASPLDRHGVGALTRFQLGD
ncbi:MAG: hypothetical protein ACE5F5_05655 [Acidimicrobiia bacterium]